MWVLERDIQAATDDYSDKECSLQSSWCSNTTTTEPLKPLVTSRFSPYHEPLTDALASPLTGETAVSPSCRVALAPIEWLKPHEQCDYVRYVQVFLETASVKGYRWPIVVDRQTGVILDGHHRFQVALTLQLRCVPAVLVDYLRDDRIGVRLWGSELGTTVSASAEERDTLSVDDFHTVRTPRAAPRNSSTSIPPSSSWSLLVSDSGAGNTDFTSGSVTAPCAPSDATTVQSSSFYYRSFTDSAEQNEKDRATCSGQHATSASQRHLKNHSVNSFPNAKQVQQVRHSRLTPSDIIRQSQQHRSEDDPFQQPITRQSIEHLTWSHLKHSSKFFAPCASSEFQKQRTEQKETPSAECVESTTCSQERQNPLMLSPLKEAARPEFVTKPSVIAMGLSSELFPPKTTKHSISSSLYCSDSVFFPLHAL